jgi:transcriptional regulator with XRE-family HTH domain
MNRLREVRVIKRITQFQLRLSTGIHQSKISLIESGLIEPREDEKRRIAEVQGIKVVEIWANSYTIGVETIITLTKELVEELSQENQEG